MKEERSRAVKHLDTGLGTEKTQSFKVLIFYFFLVVGFGGMHCDGFFFSFPMEEDDEIKEDFLVMAFGAAVKKCFNVNDDDYNSRGLLMCNVRPADRTT